MAGLAFWMEAFLIWGAQHPDAFILVLMAIGAYYELHHGRIATMAERQTILGAAVYELMRESDNFDASQFRDDLWDEEDPYPSDWSIQADNDNE